MSNNSSSPGNGHVLGCAIDGLCLLFVNTVGWRKTATPEERLPSPAALLDWCAGAGMLDTGEAAQLRARWLERPQEALAIHRRAVALREAIYGICRSWILSEAMPEDALRVLNAALADAPPRMRVAPGGDALNWWIGPAGPGSPGVLLAPLAWSAADLMTSPRLQRVRQCEDEKGCGWLFLDESRTGTRRWCSMGECGNRAKARRHYLRKRHLKPGPAHDTGTEPR
jgi:predicted RNA-binding Zn ribbon-like protein